MGEESSTLLQEIRLVSLQSRGGELKGVDNLSRVGFEKQDFVAKSDRLSGVVSDEKKSGSVIPIAGSRALF